MGSVKIKNESVIAEGQSGFKESQLIKCKDKFGIN
jgi:hypothetical protein